MGMREGAKWNSSGDADHGNRRNLADFRLQNVFLQLAKIIQSVPEAGPDPQIQ